MFADRGLAVQHLTTASITATATASTASTASTTTTATVTASTTATSIQSSMSPIERLIRSRYSAYFLNHVDYLIATTHPHNHVRQY